MAREEIKFVLSARDRTKEAFGSAQRSLGNMQNSLKRIGIVAGAAFAGIAAAVIKTTRDLDVLAKSARQAGIGVEVFQAWRFAAEEAGVSTEAFNTAMERAGRRIGEVARGDGAALTKVFEQLGVSIFDTEGNLRSTESVIRDFSDGLSRLTTQQERAAAATALFDTEGRRLSLALAGGNAQLVKYEETARRLGIVVRGDVIEQSELFNDQLNRLGLILQAGLANSLSDLIPAITGVANAFIAALPHVTNFFDILARNEIFQANRAISDARDRMKELREEFERLTQPGSGSSLGGGFLGKSAGELRSSLQAAGGDLSDRAKEVMGELEAAEKSFNDAVARLSELQRNRESAAREPFITSLPSVGGPVSGSSGSSDGRSKVNTAAVNEALASAREFEKAVEDRRDNVSRTISSAIRGGAEDGAEGMARALLRSLQDNFINQAAQALSGLFSGAAGGGGGIGGFLGSIFGGARAYGGPVSPGRAYLVGERGPEMFMPSSGGTIIPNGGGGVTINVNNQGEPLEVTAQGESTVNGEQVVDIMVQRSVGKMFSNGSMDRLFSASGYGVRRRGT